MSSQPSDSSTLLDAAVSFLVDPNDGVAAATLDALHDFADGSPDRWLEEQIRRHHAQHAAAEALQAGASSSIQPTETAPANVVAAEGTAHLHGSVWRVPLQALAADAAQLSPSQTVDAVLLALDLERFVLGWPDSDQRSGNLDALRALAAHYGETCRVTVRRRPSPACSSTSIRHAKRAGTAASSVPATNSTSHGRPC